MTNYVAPDSALAPRAEDRFTFRIPIGEQRIELGLTLRRSARPGIRGGGTGAPRPAQPPLGGCHRARHRHVAVGAVEGPSPVAVSAEGSLSMDLAVEPQSVFLVELTA